MDDSFHFLSFFWKVATMIGTAMMLKMKIQLHDSHSTLPDIVAPLSTMGEKLVCVTSLFNC